MNDTIPTDSPSSKDEPVQGASSDIGSSDSGVENAQALDVLDEEHSDEANPAVPLAGVHATYKLLATNKVGLKAHQYPIWWRGTETPPPATWAYSFEEFTGDDSADAWAYAAAAFILRVRRQTSAGPTFAELFAHLLSDTNGLPGQFPNGLNSNERGRVSGNFRHHVAVEWRRRAIIGWDQGTARSLRIGRNFRKRSTERFRISSPDVSKTRIAELTVPHHADSADKTGWQKRPLGRNNPYQGPAPGDPEARSRAVPVDPHRRLAEAVASLAEDPEYYVQVFANILRSIKSIPQAQITKREVRAFIESGKFTSKEWAEISVSVDRDSLQSSESEDWVLNIFDTMSTEDAASHLEWDEDFVQVAVTAGQLYAVEVSGRLRFPLWQFKAGSPTTLLHRLPELIKALNQRQWQSAVGLMRAPHRSLVAKGQRTPSQWLRDGGDIDDVIRIVVMSDLEER